MDALVQSIASLVNTTDALAEIISRVTKNVSETSQADEAFTVALVYLENVRGQFLNLVASAQEASSLNQATKLQIQQATNQLEQSQKKFKDQLQLASKESVEHIKKQLMLTSKEMAEDSKKMAENANKAIMNSSSAMADQIYNLEYTVDGLDQCNDDALTQSKEVKETLDQTQEALVQAKEVTVLTVEELKLAAEDMKRERLLFKDQHDRLEQRIKEMHQFLEGKDAESKGLKALYTKLSSHAIRSVQNATNFRDAQYKYLVDGFARFEQKIAFITHHISSNSASSGKVSNAVTTNDVSKVDKTSNSPKSNMMEYKITELQKTIRDLEYERDVLAGSKKLLELRLAKFEKEALAPSPTAPVQPVVPDTPCPTLKSIKSKRSLTEAGELLAQLTLSGSETTITTAVASARPSVESLIQPDLWERLISPALLSDEIKRRLRLIKPQVTGGLRLETLFLRVVTIAVHDQAWENFGSFLKEGTISQWYCIDGLVKNGWRGSVILVDHECDGRKGEEGKGGECLRVMRTQLDYGKVIFRQRNF